MLEFWEFLDAELFGDMPRLLRAEYEDDFGTAMTDEYFFLDYAVVCGFGTFPLSAKLSGVIGFLAGLVEFLDCGISSCTLSFKFLVMCLNSSFLVERSGDFTRGLVGETLETLILFCFSLDEEATSSNKWLDWSCTEM